MLNPAVRWHMTFTFDLDSHFSILADKFPKLLTLNLTQFGMNVCHVAPVSDYISVTFDPWPRELKSTELRSLIQCRVSSSHRNDDKRLIRNSECSSTSEVTVPRYRTCHVILVRQSTWYQRHVSVRSVTARASSVTLALRQRWCCEIHAGV